MRRALAPLIATALLLFLVATFSGCGNDSSGGVFAAGCNPGACDGPFRGGRSGVGGTAPTVTGHLNGQMISFRTFYTSCLGVYPDGRSCGYDGRRLEATVAIGGDCQFTVEGRDVDDPATLAVTGSLDSDSCRISGSFDLDYGSCCGEAGSWSVSPGSFLPF